MAAGNIVALICLLVAAQFTFPISWEIAPLLMLVEPL